jgi:hypothetical protein
MMQSATAKTLILCGVLFPAGLLLGQQPSAPPPAADGTKPESKKSDGPKPGSLEEALADALRGNPDIRVAEAKMREAEAELYRARLLVTQKVVALKAAVDVAKMNVDHAQMALERMAKLVSAGQAPRPELEQATAQLQSAKADLAKVQGELSAVCGKMPGDTKVVASWLQSIAFAPDGGTFATTMADGSVRLWDTKSGKAQPINAWLTETTYQVPLKPGSMTEKAMKFLDTPFQLDKPLGVAPLNDVLESILFALKPEVRFRVLTNAGEKQCTLMSGRLPVGAWLLALEDESPDLRFVLREYGILVTTKDRVPEGAVLLRNAWPTREQPVKPTSKSEAPPAAKQ